MRGNWEKSWDIKELGDGKSIAEQDQGILSGHVAQPLPHNLKRIDFASESSGD